MKSIHIAASLTCVFILSACGGGEVASIPPTVIAPPPAPPPPPPPPTTITPPAGATLLEASNSGASLTGAFAASSSGTTSNGNLNSGFTVTFNRATSTYTVASNNIVFLPTRSFGGAGSNTSTDNQAGTTTIDIPAANGQPGRTLLISTPGAAAALVRLTYSGFGVTLADAPPSSQLDTAAFTYGLPTPFASRPVTGTADYTGRALAIYTPSDSRLAQSVLNGESALSANFGTNTFGAAISLSGQNPNTSAINDFGIYSGAGNIVSSADGTRLEFMSFAAGNTIVGTPLSGRADGALYGPLATEYGFQFSFRYSTAAANLFPGSVTGVAFGSR